MPRTLLLLTLTILSISALVAAQAAARDIIPAGTILQCTLDEPNFSSKTAMVGDPVLCHLGSLGSFGHSVFPRGAMLGGHLQDFKNPGRFVGKGWIAIEFDRLVLPGAEILPLSAKVISAPHMKVDAQGDIHGKGHPKRDVVGWMIPVLWPIKVATLPMRGPYPALKGETRLSLRLMEDVEVPFPAMGRNSVPMPPWVNPSGYRPSSYGFVRSAPSQPTVVQSAYYPEHTTAEPSPRRAEPAADQQLTVIAFKDGSAYLAHQYWIEGGEMHGVSDNGVEKTFPLQKIDLSQTVHVNQERNIEFVLQSKDALEQ